MQTEDFLSDITEPQARPTFAHIVAVLVHKENKPFLIFEVIIVCLYSSTYYLRIDLNFLFLKFLMPDAAEHLPLPHEKGVSISVST